MSINTNTTKKLDAIFSFLQENRAYNSVIQFGFYHESISPYDTIVEKLKSLLWRIQNTQQRPQLDHVGAFWRNLEGRIDEVVDFSTLLKALGITSSDHNYVLLFKALKNQPSWGNKTAALFARAIYHTHGDSRFNAFTFLPGVPKLITPEDKLYLPVDQVILNLFQRSLGVENPDFTRINNLLFERYAGAQLEIWDDLWFWGFITQKGSASGRTFEWNEAKYYSIQHAPKGERTIAEVKKKAKMFIDKLN